jgi:positive regulator of sigma E activity
MEQIGRIEKINGNTATISVNRIKACGGSCSHCSSSCSQNGIEVEIEVTSDIQIGDYVEIKTENQVMIKHILVIYGIPLTLVLFTIFAAYYLLGSAPNKDIISAVSGLLSLIVSHFILKKYDKWEMANMPIKYSVEKKF